MPTNEYFDNSLFSALEAGTRARGEAVDGKLDGATAGFDKLPTEAQLKRGTINYAGASTGSGGAYIVTLPYTPSGYVDGLDIFFKANHASPGASTANVNSLGVKSLRRNDGTALIADDMIANKTYHYKYNLTSGYLELQQIVGAAAYAAATAADAIATAADAVSTAADVVTTAANVALTNADVVTTAANVVATNGNIGKLATSNWTEQTNPEDNAFVAAAGGGTDPLTPIYVGISSDGTNRAVSSTDGQTWSAVAAAEANTWADVVYKGPTPPLFVAVSTDGTNRVMTSATGDSWVAVAAAAANQWTAVGWSPDLTQLCAVSASGVGNRVMTSTTGASWDSQTSAADSGWIDITWGAGNLQKWISVAATGTFRVMTSADGESWATAVAAEANAWQGVAYSPTLDLAVAVSTTGTNRVMKSTDAETWNAVSSVVMNANGWSAIEWIDELAIFVAVGGSGAIATSVDGDNWLLRPTPNTRDYKAIGWAADIGAVVVFDDTGTGDRILTSLFYA
jgi:hypothetical protein